MAAYPTLVCHSFNIHFELICHEANNWEDDKAGKYTCCTVGTRDYQCVPGKKAQKGKILYAFQDSHMTYASCRNTNKEEL